MEPSESTKSFYNFLINTFNQANITGTTDISHAQSNYLFIIISPYILEKACIDGLDVDIKMGDEGKITINDQCFDVIEIKPGISVLGILKR